ncbi:MAG: hypothetical protein AAF702_05315 [Chloroflexota bacterium]
MALLNILLSSSDGNTYTAECELGIAAERVGDDDIGGKNGDVFVLTASSEASENMIIDTEMLKVVDMTTLSNEELVAIPILGIGIPSALVD